VNGVIGKLGQNVHVLVEKDSETEAERAMELIVRVVHARQKNVQFKTV